MRDTFMLCNQYVRDTLIVESGDIREIHLIYPSVTPYFVSLL
jgi:hypothetical protein